MKPSLVKSLAIFLTLLTLTFSSIGVAPAYAAATLTVINTDDSGAGSLRQAIEDALSGDTIIFDSGLSGQTIRLATTLTLSKNVTIDGSALASPITISGDTDNDGAGNVRVLIVNYGVTATINTLKITKGISVGLGAAGIQNSNGATLTIKNVTFSQNTAKYSGGAIDNGGILTVTNSTFSNNSAGWDGGGIYNEGISAVVTNSTFSGNSATLSGGAINNRTTLTVVNSTFTDNYAKVGGGILHGYYSMTVTNSTFSGNISTDGIGGGISDSSTGAVLHFSNNIIANSTGTDCLLAGTFIANINNLVEDGSCSASLSGDPKLAALADNGGPTQTMALQTGSSAIDAGDDATCSADPVNGLDQRGIVRPQGAHCDIGAYEGSVASGATFVDVPTTHPLYKYIEALYDAGFTAGCSTSPLMFCPDTVLDRAQSAVFMLRGQLGSGYTPPPAPWDTFGDNWTGFEWAEPWAEGMYQEGLTTGCQTSPLLYCPANQLPRVEASIFGLRMKYGVGYTPPSATGTLFADFPSTDPSYWGIDWAEQAYLDGLLPACGIDSGTGKPMFCPSELVNRGWGAYLIVKAKNLPTP